MSEAPDKLRIGVAGWDYKDWKGKVYPEGAGRDFDPLEYLARYFDVVEVNSSFYRPFPARYAKAWLARVADHPEFGFTAKLWRRFTHERDAPPTGEDVAAVREGMDALAEEERLLAVLAQFPWSFKNEPAEREWLAAIVDTFGDWPLVLEVRHASWDEPETLEWLAERNVGLAAIDQPLHENSLEAVVRPISPVRYFRFHGRRYDTWFAEGRPTHERYDYLYSEEELRPWSERLREARADATAKAVIAITNNHYQGQAAVNALQLKAWSNGGKVRVPPPLLAAYPEDLGAVADEPLEEDPAGDVPAQRELFE
ncbi:MAG TPA: DUF72 domain-containing protein [Gemmatimonadota bacterium]|nr:DUF72 domain-containing protein [Gemmatimonadota bacterium]